LDEQPIKGKPVKNITSTQKSKEGRQRTLGGAAVMQFSDRHLPTSPNLRGEDFRRDPS
jgi:hypothetical protein